MYLPDEVVRRPYQRPTYNFTTGEKGLDLKEYFNTFQNWQQTMFFSQQINESGHNTRTKKDFTFPLARTIILRIPSSHGVYVNFKVKFSNCESSQFSYAYFVFILRLQRQKYLILTLPGVVGDLIATLWHLLVHVDNLGDILVVNGCFPEI